MHLISIRRFLNQNGIEPEAGGEGCSAFCLGLMDRVGRGLFTGDPTATAPPELAQAWVTLREEWAGGGAEPEYYLGRVAEILGRCELENAARVRSQAAEMRSLLLTLNQALLSMAEGNERGVGRLQRIETRVKSVAEKNDIVSLRAALRETVQFVAEESARQRQETAALLERTEHDLARARTTFLRAQTALPGREEAVRSIGALGDSPLAGKTAVVLAQIDRFHALASRFGAAVGDDLLSHMAAAWQDLAHEGVIYRWDQDALAWVLAVDATPRTHLESRLNAPFEHRVAAGGRTALLSVSVRWMSAAVSGGPVEALIQQMDRFHAG